MIFRSLVPVLPAWCLNRHHLMFRDGLERVKISPSATVGDLKQVIAANLLAGGMGTGSQEFTLSQNPELLTTRDDVGFCPGAYVLMIDFVDLQVNNCSSI